jgi:hypothetical protein
MRYALVLLAACCGAAPAAFAQMSPGGMHGPQLQPRGSDETPLPAAVPGVGDRNLQTSQNVAKPQTGDPTAQLFAAINSGNFNSATDAISRGADLNAQNALGETPIALSVALERNSITFLLLAARNVSGGGFPDANAPSSPVAAAPAMRASSLHRTVAPPAVPVRLVEQPRHPVGPVSATGTPDANSGFLGFNP